MTLLAVAHRAGNSLPRLASAVELGADIVEADVRSYRRRLEVRHAKTLGPLPWLWDAGQLYPASTPRLGLAELLLAADHGTTFMLDLKGVRIGPGRRVAAALHELAPQRPVLVCSRFWPALRPFEPIPWVRTVRSARGRGDLALLLRVLERDRNRDRNRDRGGVSIHRSLLDAALVERLHRLVSLVLTWPVNDAAALAEVARYAESGTVGVISDDDAVLAEVIARRSAG